MRLVFAIHDLNAWGGHDRSTLEIARRLSHRWPVDVYSYTLNDPRGIEAWGKVRFHRIWPHFRRPAVLKLGIYYAATLPLLGLGGRGSSVVHATGTCSLLSDVVQVQFVQAAWKDRRMEDEASLPEPGLRGLYHEALLKANVAVEKAVYTPRKTYIAIARCVADELEKYFGVGSRAHVIHHGVDSELFKPAPAGDADRAKLRAELGAKEDDVLALFVGAYDRKGLKRSIEAMAKLSPEAARRAKLVAVGGGDEAAFRQFAREAGVSERVSLVGHRKDIERFYRAADLFLLPTLYEPFGLVILEAMASGLAPVVSRLAGASELIENGKSGVLIETPSDAVEIAARMEPLVLDEAKRRAVGAAARAVAVARSWDQVAREYEKVLEPLLSPSLGSKGRA
jgi:glycosyltransferase involved in cell wall biosynthesis